MGRIEPNNRTIQPPNNRNPLKCFLAPHSRVNSSLNPSIPLFPRSTPQPRFLARRVLHPIKSPMSLVSGAKGGRSGDRSSSPLPPPLVLLLDPPPYLSLLGVGLPSSLRVIGISELSRVTVHPRSPIPPHGSFLHILPPVAC